MKILFISRAYPPVVGGIEMQNFGLANSLSKIANVKIIANKKGKKNLIPFLFLVFLKGIFCLSKYDVILFGDGVLTPLGVIFKFFYPQKKYIAVIHGLDITFAYKKSLLGKVYKKINIPAHKRMDKLIMVGNETIEEAAKIGIPRKLCVFIPNGLDVNEIRGQYTRSDCEKLIGLNLEGKKLIFRGGRFVKHKGVEWFIREVMKKLPENYVFVAAGGIVTSVAGDESDFENCQKAAKDNYLQNRVVLLGNVSRESMKVLFNQCDLYVSPNIGVPGSMEGFGINAIEGAACGKVVLASNLQGLKDAVRDGYNGFLVEPENANAWSEKIIKILSDEKFCYEFGKKAHKYVVDNFSWEKIAAKYLEEIEKIVSKELN